MNILLITANATIEKLFVLSAEKKGDSVHIGTTENIPEGEYQVVFIDKDLYNDELFEKLKFLHSDAKFVLIVFKNDEKKVGFDEYLIKPFLPTDLMDLLERLSFEVFIEDKNDDLELDEDMDIEGFEDLKD